MVWIFALGIIGFCIVSVGFRKLVFGLIAAAVLIGGGLMGYFAYDAHVANQRAAEQEAKERIAAVSYPVCGGSDQTLAWFKAGGNCRPATADVSAAPAVLSVAESKPR